MKRIDFIIETLVKAGFRTSLKGFDQFCECVELYSDDRSRTIDSIYAQVALFHGCTKSSVEKNLRRLFSSSDAAASLGRLFGAQPVVAGNKELVAMFANYLALHRDKYSNENGARPGAAYGYGFC